MHPAPIRALLVAALLLGPMLSAQEETPPPNDQLISRLGQVTLKYSEAAITGKVVSVSRLKEGRELSRLAVEEVLWGVLPEKTVLVLTRVSGLFAPSEGRVLVFVRRLSPDSKVFYNQGKFSIDTKTGRRKLETIQRLLEIESIPSIELRNRSLRVFALRNLTDSNSWVQWNAAQEFAFLVEKRDGVLTAVERQKIAQVAFSTPDVKLTQYLNRILQKDASSPKSSLRRKSSPTPPATPRHNAEPDSSPPPRPVRPDNPKDPPRKDKSIEDRIKALHELAARPEETATQLLLDALNNPDPRIRGSAAFLLGDRGEAALKSLLVTLRQDPSIRVRRNAILALGRIGSPASEEALLAAFSDPEMTREAASALIALGEPRALEEVRARRSALPPDHPERRYLDDLLTRWRDQLPRDR